MTNEKRIAILQNVLGWHTGTLAHINYKQYLNSLNLLDNNWVRYMDTLLTNGHYTEWLLDAFVWGGTLEQFPFWDQLYKELDQK